MNVHAPAALRGVFAPVLTPFRADGSPCAKRFAAHCRWLLDQDVGLAVFGTNSEANSLAVAEKRRLLDALGEVGLPMARMLPGTGACAAADVVELTRHAVHAGCAGVLMLPPFYYKGVSDEGLYRSFAQIIEAVADERLRIYLYHIPPVAQVGISPELIDRLLKAFPGAIAGIKDSSGDWANTSRLLGEFGPRGLGVFAGSEAFLLQTLRAGGRGCITATANINPAAIADLHRHWSGPDPEARQRGLIELRALIQALPMIAAMKAVIAWKSGDPHWARVRPPLVELGPQASEALRRELDQRGFQMPGAAALAAADA
jgi:4-hydroxy-tetrahydrodipicolinate synthase